MSADAPVRFTKQMRLDFWVTECKVCPKRFRRHSGPTEQAVDEWWAKHVLTQVHLSSATSDGQPSAEEQRLAQIFGMELPDNKVAPRDRSGRVVVRPHVGRRWKQQDNPRA